MNASETTRAAEQIAAATVVIFRNDPAGGPPQLLMVTRSRALSFAGGAAVFPGGRVDPADRALAGRIDCGLSEDETAHRIAAIRETLEETGLVIGVEQRIDPAEAAQARTLLLSSGELAPVLDETGWRLDLSRIVPFARWFPKNEKLPRVFDTRFYLADLGTGAVEVAVDETENTRLFWTSAADALTAADRGDISVIFPTRRNLERLARFDSFAAAQAHAAAHPVRTIVPFMEERGGEAWICIPDDAGYPITGERLETMQRG